MSRGPEAPKYLQVRESSDLEEKGAVALILEQPSGEFCGVAPMSLGSGLATCEDLVVPEGILPGGDWTIYMSARLEAPLWTLGDFLWDLPDAEPPVLFSLSGGQEGYLGNFRIGELDGKSGTLAFRWQLSLLS